MPLVRVRRTYKAYQESSETIELQTYPFTPRSIGALHQAKAPEMAEVNNSPAKNSDYSLSTFFTQKNLKSTWGKIASSVSAISMGTVVEALVAAALKETFCRGIDYFFDTNFLETTQDFIEQHLDF